MVIARRNGAIVFGAVLAIGFTPVRAGNGGVTMSGPTTFDQPDGASLFQAICQGCHMSNAQGAIGAGAYPALSQNSKLAAAAYPIVTVVKGRKGMPPLASYLSDAQVAEVINYVRTHFGNSYTDSVSPEMVKAVRQAP